MHSHIRHIAKAVSIGLSVTLTRKWLIYFWYFPTLNSTTNFANHATATEDKKTVGFKYLKMLSTSDPMFQKFYLGGIEINWIAQSI
jgi:hypothetical protein